MRPKTKVYGPRTDLTGTHGPRMALVGGGRPAVVAGERPPRAVGRRGGSISLDRLDHDSAKVGLVRATPNTAYEADVIVIRLAGLPIESLESPRGVDVRKFEAPTRCVGGLVHAIPTELGGIASIRSDLCPADRTFLARIIWDHGAV